MFWPERSCADWEVGKAMHVKKTKREVKSDEFV